MFKRLMASIGLMIFGGLAHDLYKTALEAAYYKGKCDRYEEVKPLLDAQKNFINELIEELKEKEA